MLDFSELTVKKQKLLVFGPNSFKASLRIIGTVKFHYVGVYKDLSVCFCTAWGAL